MLHVLAGWAEICGKANPKRIRKWRRGLDRQRRQARFEQLEDRLVLAGGLIPAGLQSTLAASLMPVLTNSLQSTSNLPLIGSGLNDPAFINSQITQLIDDLDTASVTPGAVTVTPGLPTTFSVNTPLHSTGVKNVQISGNGLGPFSLSTNPQLNQTGMASKQEYLSA